MATSTTINNNVSTTTAPTSASNATNANAKLSRNFMSQFRDNKTKELKNLTSAQFMEVWSHYDHDGKLIIS